MRISDWSSDVCSSDLGADLDFLPKPRTDQRVVDEQQALAERHAQMVGEFERCRAGTALGAVDDDIVRENAGLQHGLDDCHELPRLADAKLEPHRLALRHSS